MPDSKSRRSLGCDIAHTLRGEGHDASEDGSGRGTPLVAAPLGAHGWRGDLDHETYVPTAFAWQGGGTQGDLGFRPGSDIAGVVGAHQTQAVAFAENSRAELRLEGGDGSRTGALSGGGGKVGQGAPAVAGCFGVRRLMPVECERLMGLPDNFTRIPWRGRPVEECPDGPRYKAIGNSIAVPVLAWIGRRMAQVDAIRRGVTTPPASGPTRR